MTIFLTALGMRLFSISVKAGTTHIAESHISALRVVIASKVGFSIS